MISGKLFILLISITAVLSVDPPATVSSVDLSKYLGQWYELASIPFFWTRGCTCTKANYALNEDGTVKVVNSCVSSGKVSSYTGKAWAVDSTNSKLKVQFFWPFSGDYWIVALDENYQWSVVSAPGRDYLWILSRTSSIEPSLYNSIIKKIQDIGIPIDSLKVTDQSCHSSFF